MYRLVVLRSLCAYATIFCFCLLLFPCRFCCSKLVLFCPAACLFYPCLSSIKEGMCSWACLVFFVFSLILYSFSFTHFLLLTHFVIPCFFSSCLFILGLTPIVLYKKIWAFVGQIVFTGSKGIRPNWSYFAKVILLKNCILL